MMWLYFLLGALATWRITYDLINLAGPFGLYGKWRSFVESKMETWPDWAVDGWTCFHCVSWSVGFLVALLLPWSDVRSYILYAIAISGAVTLVARYCKAMYGADLFD